MFICYCILLLIVYRVLNVLLKHVENPIHKKYTYMNVALYELYTLVKSKSYKLCWGEGIYKL